MLALVFYDILKFAHVALAVAWIGGGLMMSILAEFAREVGLIGQRFFTPISLMVLGLGFWLVHKGHWGYHTWIIVSLVGYGLSTLIGAGFIGPQSAKLAKVIATEGPDATVVKDRIRMIVTVARVDLVILFTVVFFMVTKIGQ